VERFEQPGPDATSLGTTDLGPGYGNDLLELDGRLYGTRYGGNALVAVDIATGTVTGEPIPMPGGALGAASSGESIWVAVHGSSSGRPGSVVEVRDGAIVDEIPLDSRPFGIEVVSGHPWVTFNDTGEVAMVDPATGQATRFPVGPRPVDIRLLGEQLWVTVSGENRIALLDPFSGNELGSIDVGASPWKVEEGFGAMWVTNQGDDTVMRIDPTTLEPGEAITVGDKPDEIAVGPDQLFIGNSGATSVSVIDPG
jgi:YVTN family beta-propeller protein